MSSLIILPWFYLLVALIYRNDSNINYIFNLKLIVIIVN